MHILEPLETSHTEVMFVVTEDSHSIDATLFTLSIAVLVPSTGENQSVTFFASLGRIKCISCILLESSEAWSSHVWICLQKSLAKIFELLLLIIRDTFLSCLSENIIADILPSHDHPIDLQRIYELLHGLRVECFHLIRSKLRCMLNFSVSCLFLFLLRRLHSLLFFHLVDQTLLVLHRPFKTPSLVRLRLVKRCIAHLLRRSIITDCDWSLTASLNHRLYLWAVHQLQHDSLKLLLRTIKDHFGREFFGHHCLRSVNR